MRRVSSSSAASASASASSAAVESPMLALPSAFQEMSTAPVASRSIGASSGNGLNSWISKPKSRRWRF